jgi:hypothetical protein
LWVYASTNYQNNLIGETPIRLLEPLGLRYRLQLRLIVFYRDTIIPNLRFNLSYTLSKPGAAHKLKHPTTWEVIGYGANDWYRANSSSVRKKIVS